MFDPESPHRPPFIVAELSANHNGDFVRAIKMIEAAKAAGADAVKFQCYDPDSLTIDCCRHDFRVKHPLWKGMGTLYSLYKHAHTPMEWMPSLFARSREIGITPFASVFCERGLGILEDLECQYYKIASPEITDVGLIRMVVATGKPLILSTGMADDAEIRRSVDIAVGGAVPFTLLHCVSGYPTPADRANLRRLSQLHSTYKTNHVGISDHSPGWSVAVAATALGARMIEKHFTLARADGGPDCEFSMEPEEFATMCRNVRDIYLACGPQDSWEAEKDTRQMRRSLYVVEDIREGETFTTKNIRAIRPSYGLPPMELENVLGRSASRPLERGMALTWDMISLRDDPEPLSRPR